jgi:hypothetical protein
MNIGYAIRKVRKRKKNEIDNKCDLHQHWKNEEAEMEYDSKSIDGFGK